MSNDGLNLMCKLMVPNLLHKHDKNWSNRLWQLSEAYDQGGIDAYNAALSDMHAENGNSAGISMRI